LDDEEMLKLDDALSEAFRSHIQQSTLQRQKKEYEKNLLHFRLRVLEVVEGFVKRHKTSSLLLDLLGPLVRLACSNMSELRDKAGGVVAKLVKGKVPRVGVDECLLSSLTKNLVSLLRKVSSERVQLVTGAVCWLVRVWKGLGVDLLMWTAPFKDCIQDFSTKKGSSGYYSLLLALTQRFPEIGWALFGDLTDSCLREVSMFRKTQCYQVLGSLLHGKMQCSGDDVDGCLTQIIEDFRRLSSEVTAKEEVNKAECKLLKEVMSVVSSLLDAATSYSSDEHRLEEVVLSLQDIPGVHRDKSLLSSCHQMMVALEYWQDIPSPKRKKQ
jgi:hypothetical protein